MSNLRSKHAFFVLDLLGYASNHGVPTFSRMDKPMCNYPKAFKFIPSKLESAYDNS